MNESTNMHHERLDAYGVITQLGRALAAVLKRLPRGEGRAADQLRRAGDSVMQNYCEGAGRFQPRDKAHYYDIAAASAAECGGTLTVLATRRAVSPLDLDHARALLHRSIRLLVGLAKSARRRAG